MSAKSAVRCHGKAAHKQERRAGDPHAVRQAALSQWSVSQRPRDSLGLARAMGSIAPMHHRDRI
jgi:hypothetical protein